MNNRRRADQLAGRDGSTEALNVAALARVKESKLVRLKAAGYARDATVPLYRTLFRPRTIGCR